MRKLLSLRRPAVRIALVILIAAGLAACQPTGNVRCDKLWQAVKVATDQGFTVNCDTKRPPPDYGNGPIAGQVTMANKRVEIWPQTVPKEADLKVVLWHEVGHTFGYGELDAERYAWCHLTSRERAGVSGWFLDATPTPAVCARLG